MLDEISDELDKEDMLLLFPTAFSAVLILSVLLLHPEPGMIGITILLSIMVSVSPYAIWKYFRVKKVKGMERQFPNFLRDLVEAKKSGLTLTEALREASDNEYGMLNEEVEKMSNQLSWNMSFDEVMTKFGERNNDSDMISRTVKIIMEAKRSGGNIISAMETISSDVSRLIEIEKKRKSEMSQHAAVMYLIYFMFVGITIILSKILVPMTTEIGAGDDALMMGDGGAVCAPATQPSEELICSVFEGIALSLGIGAGEGAYYEGLFLSMVLVQGMFSGLIIGQIRNNSAVSGIKHSLIMTGIGLVSYIIASRYVTIEII